MALTSPSSLEILIAPTSSTPRLRARPDDPSGESGFFSATWLFLLALIEGIPACEKRGERLDVHQCACLHAQGDSDPVALPPQTFSASLKNLIDEPRGKAVFPRPFGDRDAAIRNRSLDFLYRLCDVWGMHYFVFMHADEFTLAHVYLLLPCFLYNFLHECTK